MDSFTTFGDPSASSHLDANVEPIVGVTEEPKDTIMAFFEKYADFTYDLSVSPARQFDQLVELNNWDRGSSEFQTALLQLQTAMLQQFDPSIQIPTSVMELERESVEDSSKPNPSKKKKKKKKRKEKANFSAMLAAIDPVSQREEGGDPSNESLSVSSRINQASGEEGINVEGTDSNSAAILSLPSIPMLIPSSTHQTPNAANLSTVSIDQETTPVPVNVADAGESSAVTEQPRHKKKYRTGLRNKAAGYAKWILVAESLACEPINSGGTLTPSMKLDVTPVPVNAATTGEHFCEPEYPRRPKKTTKGKGRRKRKRKILEGDDIVVYPRTMLVAEKVAPGAQFSSTVLPGFVRPIFTPTHVCPDTVAISSPSINQVKGKKKKKKKNLKGKDVTGYPKSTLTAEKLACGAKVASTPSPGFAKSVPPPTRPVPDIVVIPRAPTQTAVAGGAYSGGTGEPKRKNKPKKGMNRAKDTGVTAMSIPIAQVTGANFHTPSSTATTNTRYVGGTQWTQAIGPLDAFFSNYPSFNARRNRIASVATQLIELRAHEGWWGPRSYLFFAALKKYQQALIQQFDASYGTNEDDLTTWQRILSLTDVDVPNTVDECKSLADSMFVNIVDLIDASLQPGDAQKFIMVFESAEALNTYTVGTKKIFPKGQARNGLLKHLLREMS